MIDLNDISKMYPMAGGGVTALKNVSLFVRRGEFVAICGTSGSGKTTLLNIIGCMDNCSEGTYRLDGVHVNALSDEGKSRIRNEKIGFVLQDFALISDQTVLFNVMLPLLLGKTPYIEIRSKAIAALEKVGMQKSLKKKVNQLSGGQRQRVAIARAIVNYPQILLADEPTGQLDSESSKQIMEVLKSLNNQGVTILMVTHDVAVAQYADRVLHVLDGRLIDAVDDASV